MRVQILGSAAAECVPAVWCDCDVCKKARINRGKDIRRRTSYLIDEDTLVDLGPDFFCQLIDFGIDERKLKRIIFTHRHEDHLNPIELLWRRHGFSKVSGEPLHLLGCHYVFTRIAQMHSLIDLGSDLTPLQIKEIVLEHGKLQQDGDISVLPMNANHDPGHSPFVHIISRNGKKVFICNDTGYLSEESMKVCAGQQADLLIIDCTMCFSAPDSPNGHLGVNSVCRQIELFKENGAIKPDAKLVVNHFSHNGDSTQSRLEAFFNPKGIEVGFDGKVIEF